MNFDRPEEVITVEQRFADLGSKLVNFAHPTDIELTFTPITGQALPVGVEPTRAILRGSIDLTCQLFSGDIKDLPPNLQIDGPVALNANIINQLNANTAFIDWRLNGPITICGTKDLSTDAKHDLALKLGTSSGVGMTSDVTFE